MITYLDFNGLMDFNPCTLPVEFRDMACLWTSIKKQKTNEITSDRL